MWWSLLACTDPPSAVATTEGPTDGASVTASPPTGETSPSTPTTTPSTPPDDTGITVPLVEADCTALLPLPATYATLSFVPGSEDFFFDAAGHELGVSGGNLWQTPFGGPKELVVPGLSDSIRGARMFADGRVVLADPEHATLVIADPVTGGSGVMATSVVNPNGIAIGADGWAYVALTGAIVRAHPDTGVVETVTELPNHSIDGLTFTPDYQRIWFDEEFGKLWYTDWVDGAWTAPVRGPDLPIGGFSLLDGVTMDACGNLYVVEMSGTVWRVGADLSVAEVFTVPGLGVISAANFGSGVGGWERDTLYVMDFLGKLYAAPLGVPGKWEPYMPGY